MSPYGVVRVETVMKKEAVDFISLIYRKSRAAHKRQFSMQGTLKDIT